MIKGLDSSTAQSLLQRYRALDNTATDVDARPDFVQFSTGAEKHEVMLSRASYLQRTTDETNNVTVTRVQVPRWYDLAGQVEVETICRSAHGAYSGWLGGAEVGAATQDQARNTFYAWQKPLVKPGGG